MGKNFLLVILLLLTGDAFAQGGIWTWMNGTAAATGNYGTKGVAAATNLPPGRYQACYWTDKKGNFWLFGGVMNTSNGLGNDLWQYDVSTGMWTWVSGPDCISAPNPSGVPGTKGIPSGNNYPSARGYGANCWTDNNGDLWLYGGIGGRNDLWRYNIAANQWTWVHGNQTATMPVFGQMGVASTANTPGDMQEVKSAWVDAANNLWMFGGNGCNTMWKYDISANTWTWVNGSSLPAVGAYGSYQVEAAGNQPPPRWSYTRWKDSADNMYLFAGFGNNNEYYNDVWRYRPSTDMWTWVGGTNKGNDTGRWPPAYCTFSDNYYPAPRYENQTAFSNNGCAKAFWTFGGWGSTNNFRNDLWLFHTGKLQWSLVSGSRTSNPPGNYGTKGLPSPLNMPPGKAGQCMWIDKQNNLWLFGGFTPGTVLTNDLWRFVPDTACIDRGLFSTAVPPVMPDTILCPGDSTIMKTGSHDSLIFLPDAYLRPNADSSLVTFRPPVTTAYTVVLKRSICNGGDDTMRFRIHVLPVDTVRLTPPQPLRICKGDTSNMSVNPDWTVTAAPNSGVTYRAGGIDFYPEQTTTYTVSAMSSARCNTGPAAISFTIVVDTQKLTHMPAMADVDLCEADTIEYRVGVKRDQLMIQPASYFSISEDSTLLRFWPPVTTRYTLTGRQSSACEQIIDKVSFSINRSVLKASFFVSPKETDQNHPWFQLSNTTKGGSRYAWYRDGAYWTGDNSPVVTVNDTGTYCFTLVASDVSGCTDTASECGRVVHAQIYSPTAFTPNGDGKNDYFRAFTHNVKIEELSVYNRFGNRVFVAYNNDQFWDGTYKGKPCDVGTYFYVIRYRILEQEPVMIKGDVTLIR